MKAKTAMLVGLVLSMAAMAEPTPINSNAIVQDDIEYYMQTDKSVYNLGEEVEMLYRVTNLGDESVQFSFYCGPVTDRCDYIIEKDGVRVWDNIHRPVSWAFTFLILSPLESYEYTHTWDMMNDNGTTWTSDDDFLINPGLYNVIGELSNLGSGYGVPVSVSIEVIPEPATTYYVDALNGDDDNDGLSLETAFATIQSPIDSADDGDTVIVAPGTYTGGGNRDIDFLGKAITVRSIDPNDPNIVAATIIDCNGTESDPHRGFYFHNGEDANCVLSGLTITGGYIMDPMFLGGGGGIYCEQSSPTITNCTITGNSAVYGGGGGICCWSGSPFITNCTITDNTAGGGGGIFCEQSSPVISNCTISGNSARYTGGGICCWASNPTITNCIISGNSTEYEGGGMSNWNSNPMVTNCTFSGNSASNGNALATDSWRQRFPSNVQLSNCILWDGGNEIWNNDGSTITITYSDVQGGWPGDGNIEADPCFVNPHSNNFHLLADSPCIDAGDNTAVPDDATDLDGNPRIIDGNNDGNPVVDMGAYELLTPQQLVINLIKEATAEKEEALQRINAALQKELVAYETLEQILESGDYGNWSRQAIFAARWKISIAIFYEEDYIKKVLEKNIDKLQRTLSVLGIEPDEVSYGNIPVPNTAASEAAVLSLHELVINLIEEALAEKAEAMEIVDAALQKERQAYELFEQMLINRDYGDWNRLDILRAKSRIYVAIKYEEYLKKVLMIITVDKLEDSLSVLGTEAYDGSG